VSAFPFVPQTFGNQCVAWTRAATQRACCVPVGGVRHSVSYTYSASGTLEVLDGASFGTGLFVNYSISASGTNTQNAAGTWSPGVSADTTVVWPAGIELIYDMLPGTKTVTAAFLAAYAEAGPGVLWGTFLELGSASYAGGPCAEIRVVTNDFCDAEPGLTKTVTWAYVNTDCEYAEASANAIYDYPTQPSWVNTGRIDYYGALLSALVIPDPAPPGGRLSPPPRLRWTYRARNMTVVVRRVLDDRRCRNLSCAEVGGLGASEALAGMMGAAMMSPEALTSADPAEVAARMEAMQMRAMGIDPRRCGGCGQ
jgi:hypothetical protein